MTKRVESALYDLIDRVYGLTGTGGGTDETFLQDGVISQVVGLNHPIRRARVPIGSEGWFYGLLQNAHPGAGALSADVTPYASVNAIAPFQTPLPQDLEIWLHGVACLRTSGTGALDRAMLELLPTSAMQAFGENNAGGGVVATSPIPLVRWDQIDATLATEVLITEQGEVWAPLNVRLRRGTTLVFRSSVNTAAATLRVILLLGVFPISLGSDVAK